MITKYRTGGNPSIEVVEVESETTGLVVINGRTVRKKGEDRSYHDTWADAKKELIRVAELEVIEAEKRLTRARCKLDNARAQRQKVTNIEDYIK